MKDDTALKYRMENLLRATEGEPRVARARKIISELNSSRRLVVGRAPLALREYFHQRIQAHGFTAE